MVKKSCISMLSVICLCLLFSSTGEKITADGTTAVSSSSDVVENNEDLGEYSELVVLDEINVNGYDIELFVEFENQEEALNNFVKKYNIIFNNLQALYDLPAVNEKNALEYFSYFLSSLDTEYIKNISDETLSEFRRFFDFYEASITNSEILDLVEKIDKSSNNQLARTVELEDSSEDLIDLALLIPYYNDMSQEVNELIQENTVTLENIPNDSSTNGITAFGLTGTAKTKAINYASKWANSNNTSQYRTFGGDCANFASQILEAAGVKQVVYQSEHSGWWHQMRKTKISWPPGYYYDHYHSVSWIRADTFARYMGIGKKATSIRQLGDMVVAGDFIAADWTGNGSWDHIGFVTQVDNYYGTYTNENGLKQYYKDFKVAQHTTNYHLWVSNKNNKWETFQRGQVVALVRR